MSKEWKCVECVKHGTDACYNGSKYEHDDCNYKLIDVDYAYEQGRADGIIYCLKHLKENHKKHGKVNYIQAIEDLEQIKENRDE